MTAYGHAAVCQLSHTTTRWLILRSYKKVHLVLETAYWIFAYFGHDFDLCWTWFWPDIGNNFGTENYLSYLPYRGYALAWTGSSTGGNLFRQDRTNIQANIKFYKQDFSWGGRLCNKAHNNEIVMYTKNQSTMICLGLYTHMIRMLWCLYV